MSRFTRVVSRDAVLALEHIQVNGGGPPVLAVHATGFCKGVWQPVVADTAALGTAMSLQLMDQRCHGASRAADITDWWHLGHDVLIAVAGRRVIGVGHSSGGAALVLAELTVPGTFASLVLIEPILPPPPHERTEEHHLAKVAAKRRRVFTDKAAAADSYRNRGPFAGWDERALAGYVECGLATQSDGSVALVCDPAVEADFYRTADAHGAYSRLGELDVPTKVVFGADTDDFEPGFFLDIAAKIPGAEAIEVAGANHFVPMQRPGLIAELVSGAVDEYGNGLLRR